MTNRQAYINLAASFFLMVAVITVYEEDIKQEVKGVETPILERGTISVKPIQSKTDSMDFHVPVHGKILELKSSGDIIWYKIGSEPVIIADQKVLVLALKDTLERMGGPCCSCKGI